jgi:hypothetical protein
MINLRWLLVFCGSIAGLSICAMLGLLQELYRVDSTFISVGVLALYVVVSLFIGWMTTLAPSSTVDLHREACAYVPELMVGLGMLGTVIGFLQMLGAAFGGIELSNVQATQAALGRMASGIGVALTTTLVGLVCSMLVQLQLVNLNIARPK